MLVWKKKDGMVYIIMLWKINSNEYFCQEIYKTLNFSMQCLIVSFVQLIKETINRMIYIWVTVMP